MGQGVVPSALQADQLVASSGGCSDPWGCPPCPRLCLCQPPGLPSWGASQGAVTLSLTLGLQEPPPPTVSTALLSTTAPSGLGLETTPACQATLRRMGRGLRPHRKPSFPSKPRHPPYSREGPGQTPSPPRRMFRGGGTCVSAAGMRLCNQRGSPGGSQAFPI